MLRQNKYFLWSFSMFHYYLIYVIIGERGTLRYVTLMLRKSYMFYFHKSRMSGLGCYIICKMWSHMLERKIGLCPHQKYISSLPERSRLGWHEYQFIYFSPQKKASHQGQTLFHNPTRETKNVGLHSSLRHQGKEDLMWCGRNGHHDESEARTNTSGICVYGNMKA